jgi:hypothetical protein
MVGPYFSYYDTEKVPIKRRTRKKRGLMRVESMRIRMNSGNEIRYSRGFQ